MSKSSKWLALMVVFALSLSALALVGCGETEEPAEEPTEEPAEEPAAADWKLVTPGTLTAGGEATYPPFELINDAGESEGFDVDLGKEIAKELGLNYEFKHYNFDALIVGLQTGAEFDMITSAMTIKPERALEIDFSDPYFDAGQILAVRVADAYVTLDDLAGKKIGVQSGTTGEAYTRENAPADVTVVPFENILQAFQALQNGDVDGVVNDLPISEAIAADPAREVKVVGEVMSSEQYGIGVNKENAALRDAINDALAKIKADGRYDAMIEKWFAAE
ncbi:MAG: basic amino acid ABC transporter substrate-binding protein [Coriobacteriia bacterium]|nr:basic amino acid ABC transporter substrate-binding protein [Coriobacteriia bacterium]